MKPAAILLLFVCLGAPVLEAQGRGIATPHNSFERIVAIVPLIGTGQVGDAIRPMFVPAQGFTQPARAAVDAAKPLIRTGIISYQWQPTDNGKSAIVEFVAMDRDSLLPIIESKVPGVRVFERGRAAQALVEAALKAEKKDFDFNQFLLKVR